MTNFLYRHRKEFFFIAGIFCVAISIRSFYLWCGYDFERDGVFYIKLVQNWVQNGIFPDARICYFPFLLPFLLAKLGMPVAHAFVAQNLLLGCLIPVELFLLMKYLHCRNAVAVAVALFAACHPALISYSCQPLRECSYFFFSLILIGLLIKIWRYDRAVDHIVFGVLTVVTFFCRMEGGEFMVFYTLTTGIRQFSFGNSWKKFWQHNFIAWGTFLLVWTIAFYPVRQNYTLALRFHQIYSFFGK